MKYALILIICLFAFQFAAGQVFDWATIEPANINTNPFLLNHSLTIDTAGQPVYARLIRNKLTYGTLYLGDFSLDKYDSSGNLIRSDTLMGKVHIKNILTDETNNLFAYGSFRDTIWVDSTHHLIIPGGNNHEFILKVNANGDPVWIKDYTQIDPDIHNIGALAIDNSDAIWIGVRTASNYSLIKKLDANGNTTTTHTQTNVLSISGLAFDSMGNLWVTGAASFGSQSFNGFSASAPFGYNFYVTRYSPGGVASWVQFVEDVTFKTPKIACDGSGNAYLSDHLNGPFMFGSITAQGPEWVYDFYLTKIDTAGNFVWLREIPAGNSSGDAGIGMTGFLTCSNDNIYVGGFLRGSVNWGDGISTNSLGYVDMLTLKYSSNGELLWAKNAGSPGADRAEAIAVDKNGNCYITGFVGDGAVFDSLVYTGEFTNSFLAKLQDDHITSIETERITSPENFELSQNYPNPFNPVTNFAFEISDFGLVSLKVYDISGKEAATIVSEKLAEGRYEYKWDASGLASGVYLYRLEAGKDFFQTRKLILLK